METCSIEVGLLRKKPCGNPAVAKCMSCEQPLCGQHAVAQLNSLGKKTGTFLCPECVAAHKQHEKTTAAGVRHVEAKRQASFAKSAAAEIAAGGPTLAKKPATPPPSPQQPPQPAQEKAKEEAPKEAGGIEFTPADGGKGGKVEYTRKSDKDPGYKGE
jgi:hypothetical protein